MRAGNAPAVPPGVWRAAGVAAALLLAAACAGDGDRRPAPPPVKRFPSPIFDGLSLGMTRAEAGRVQRLRRALTPGGRSRRVWIYEKRGEHAAELIFEGAGADAPLRRIDVHFGPSNATPQAYIDRLSRTYGTPDVVRRKATINAYGDERHEQYDTIWSDATQYVFLTERVPAGGARGRPVYYLTIKKKEITAGAPPTGYVPPPPPEGEDGEPVEGDPF